MPFKQTNDPSATYCFNALLTVGNIVTVGKVVELARKLDPHVRVIMDHWFEVCVITIYSNEPKVGAMVVAYSKVD